MPTSHQTNETDLSRIAKVFRRRFWVIAVCFLAATAAAVALTVRAEDRYESTSGLLLTGGVEPQRNADTNLQLLTLPTVAGMAAEKAPSISQEEFEESISTSQQGESDIIQISANASTPERAAEMANAYAEAFVGYRHADRSKIAAGKVSLVERAKPESSPVSPTPAKNIGFGALIGIVLGLGLALLLEQMDRRVKREDDLTDMTGLPLLATVPKRKSFDSKHLGHEPLSPAETEVFRMLRANLRYSKGQTEVRSVVVTSAEPGEGKTLVSLGLALAAASSGERVLLIEGDLRDPGLSRVLHLGGGSGLSGLLLAEGPFDFDQAVDQVDASQISDAVSGVYVDVIGAGQIPPNPTALVESKRMRDLLVAAEDSYDFVVIDTPPILVVSDAMPLIIASSGVLAVSGLGVATQGSAADLVGQLERLSVPVLGLVANFADRPARAYEGYGYGRPPQIAAARRSGPPPAG